ncbi:MAG TPA: MBL fold metallo-hydrolase [Gemmatimonadaceae bacterium]
MKSLRILASASAIAAFASAASAQPAPVVSLTRLDCGTNNAPTDVGGRMSDTYAFSGLKVQLTFSCCIVRHGDEYLVWDTGNPVGNTPTAPKTSLVDLLGQLKLTPEQVKYVAISHYHGDHTGQVSSFPRDAAHRQGRLGRAQRREIS